MDKEIRKTAEKIAKFQKIIMDKVGEYDSKKMNLALAPVVANMPSSMRLHLQIKNSLIILRIRLKNIIKLQINCDQFEGILKSKLNLPALTQQADAIANSGILFADPNSQSATLALDLGGGNSPQ